MTANFPDYFKSLQIFPDNFQFSGWFQNCPNFPDDCQFSGLFQNYPDSSTWLPIFQMIDYFPDYFKTVRIFQCTHFRGEGVPQILLKKLCKNRYIWSQNSFFSYFSHFWFILWPSSSIFNLFTIQTPFLALLGEICRLSINGMGGGRRGGQEHSLRILWQCRERQKSVFLACRERRFRTLCPESFCP